MQKIITAIVVSAMLMGLTACASLKYTSPEAVDLSGEWLVDEDLSDMVIVAASNASSRKSRPQGRGPGGGNGGGQAKGSRGGRSKQNGGSGQANPLLLEAAYAQEMTIDQVSDSMGILYQSGTYRDITWGESELRRQTIEAGWKKDVLVVKTSNGRQSMTESYTIDASADLLTIIFTVNEKEYRRVYHRKAVNRDTGV